MALPRLEDQFLTEFATESDRAVAVLGGAYLDAQLEELIANRLIRGGKRDGTRGLLDGSLRNFNSRVEAAFAIGMLADVEATDLRLLNDVRNVFAHRLHGLTFEDERVVALCARLNCIENVAGMIKDVKTRMVFSLACIQYMVELRRRIEKAIPLEEFVPKAWPPIRRAPSTSPTT